jgi:hypothetical protein
MKLRHIRVSPSFFPIEDALRAMRSLEDRLGEPLI